MLRRASAVVFLLVLMPATVSAFDHHHHSSSHHGSGGDGCGSSASSSSTSSSSSSSSSGSTGTPIPSLASSGHKIVFVTSTTYSGAIGSLQAADARCQSSANASGLTGVFQAWLSDATESAYDRTADVGPWYNTSDELAFSAKADLRSAASSELLDEYGGYPAGGAAGAWSGSDTSGAATGQDCEGWTNAGASATATTGTALGHDQAWGGGGATSACNAKAPIVCFQQ